MRLVRGADGRLRQGSSEKEIADIWAEQKRIRLAEAIKRDKELAEKKRKRQEFWKSIKKGKPARGLVLNVGPSAVPKDKIKSLLKKRPKGRLVTAGAILGVLLVAGLAFNLISGGSGKQDKKDKLASSGTDVLGAEKQTPDYKTLLPDGKSIGDLGGWERVSPKDKNPVFAYKDSIGQVSILVSQQPIPANFKGSVDTSVAKLASDFTANQKLPAAGTTAYVGTSIKGPQSVVLAKDDVLILIKSDSKVEDQQWVKYIESLK